MRTDAEGVANAPPPPKTGLNVFGVALEASVRTVPECQPAILPAVELAHPREAHPGQGHARTFRTYCQQRPCHARSKILNPSWQWPAGAESGVEAEAAVLRQTLKSVAMHSATDVG